MVLRRHVKKDIDALSKDGGDVAEAARDAVAPISLTECRLAIPRPTTGARVRDALDQGATRTLAGGAVAAAGTAGAISAGWIATAAVAGVVAAPVGMAILGVVAAAGVWKLYANREERLRGEQRARAEAIRGAAHTMAAGGSASSLVDPRSAVLCPSCSSKLIDGQTPAKVIALRWALRIAAPNVAFPSVSGQRSRGRSLPPCPGGKLLDRPYDARKAFSFGVGEWPRSAVDPDGVGRRVRRCRPDDDEQVAVGGQGA